jgi:hypothetical protein
MKKLIVLFSAVFFVFTLTGANAWAADPEPDTSVIDRHAVWTKTIEDNTGQSSGSTDAASAKTSGEDQEKQSRMGIKIEDLPWQRVG